MNVLYSGIDRTPTRRNLSASGLFAIYSVRSPPGIQSEMSCSGSMVTPRRGTMFGCAKCFHTTATWWKVCVSSESGSEKTWGRVHTSLTFCGFPLEGALTRLMRTFEPLKDPSYTHPRRDSESVHDFGSTSLTPHILLSSCSDS